MRKQSLKFDNLGDAMRSAKNAGRKGTQQFETPLEIASALSLPLTPNRCAVLDFSCGHGNLLAGVCNASTKHVLGIDVDPTATALPRTLSIDRRP